MITIEKGIKLPENLKLKGTKPQYPFEDLEIGDSFFIPETEKDNSRILLGRLKSAIGYFKNKTQHDRDFKYRRFTVRIVEEEKAENKKKIMVTGVRIWRVEDHK